MAAAAGAAEASKVPATSTRNGVVPPELKTSNMPAEPLPCETPMRAALATTESLPALMLLTPGRASPWAKTVS